MVGEDTTAQKNAPPPGWGGGWELDASDAGLSEEDADKLKERVTRHIDKGCTVKHTYVQETPVRMNVTVKH